LSRQRDAPIDQIGCSAIWGYDDVLWLDVPMDYSQTVRMTESRGDLTKPGLCFRYICRSVLLEDRSQVATFDEFENNDELVGLEYNVID
jgi:hypothetical protein